MNTLATWQRTLYFLGEAVMVGGLLWGLYRAIIIRACPAGTFNDLTLIVIGLTVSTIPLHPFGHRKYFTPMLQRVPVAAILWWVMALAGLGCSLWLRLQSPVPVGYWWFWAIVPAGLFFWFAIPSKLTDKPAAPGRAPQPPKKKDTEPAEENRDREGRGTDG